jgi:hypothetical protein
LTEPLGVMDRMKRLGRDILLSNSEERKTIRKKNSLFQIQIAGVAGVPGTQIER